MDRHPFNTRLMSVGLAFTLREANNFLKGKTEGLGQWHDIFCGLGLSQRGNRRIMKLQGTKVGKTLTSKNGRARRS